MRSVDVVLALLKADDGLAVLAEVAKHVDPDARSNFRGVLREAACELLLTVAAQVTIRDGNRAISLATDLAGLAKTVAP